MCFKTEAGFIRDALFVDSLCSSRVALSACLLAALAKTGMQMVGEGADGHFCVTIGERPCIVHDSPVDGVNLIGLPILLEIGLQLSRKEKDARSWRFGRGLPQYIDVGHVGSR